MLVFPSLNAAVFAPDSADFAGFGLNYCSVRRSCLRTVSPFCVKADSCRIKPKARTACAKQPVSAQENDVDDQLVWKIVNNVVALTILQRTFGLDLLDTFEEGVCFLPGNKGRIQAG